MLMLPFGAAAQVPATDIRNTRAAGTDTHFDIPHFASKAEWEKRKAHLRAQILMAAGLDILPERTPLTPQIFGRIDRGDYSIEKVLIQTLPGYWLGGNLYRPVGKQGKFPGIVSPHGHWKKGRLENTETGSIPARGISLARQGYVVFAYDMVGYNDTNQTPHAFGGPAEQLWAFGPLGLQLWNSIRALDFVQALPDVDAARLGATGASGGATQIFLLAAVDDRVKFSAPVNMISAIMQGGSPCENAPGLRVGAINVEIGAMMAPRPMLMVAATGDWTKNTPKEEYPAIRDIYKLYDAESNLEMIQITAPHNYNQASREAVYKFFGKKILALHDVANLKEGEIHVEKDEDMLALAGRERPAGALTYDQIFEQWKQMARRQAGETRDSGLIRRRLAQAIGTEWPAGVESARNGEKIVLSRKGVGDRVEGVWLDGQGQPALVVHSGGVNAARNSDQVKALIAAHRPILMIEPFHTTRDTSVKHYLTFHRSEDADRTQDIVTSIAWLAKDKVELIGLEKAAVWVTFAAAVAERPVVLRANLANFRGTDQDYIDNYFVPGIQRVGGIMAVRRVVQMSNVRVLHEVE
jgi:dienelactone hydrolase